MKRKRANSGDRARWYAKQYWLDATPEERLNMGEYHLRKLREYLDKQPKLLDNKSPSRNVRNRKQQQ